MSVKIRPDYVNPLTTMNKRSPRGPGQPAGRRKDSVSELQTKQQQLQNQMLLLKATGTDAAGAVDTQKALEAELKQVSAELRAAKAGPAQAAEQAGKLPPAREKNQDWYEPETAQTASPGVYQVERDEEEGYRISFPPYSE